MDLTKHLNLKYFLDTQAKSFEIHKKSPLHSHYVRGIMM